MIPDEWTKIYFGDVAHFKNGLNFVKSDEGDLVKYIGVGDFKNYFRLRSTSGLSYAQISGKIKPDELLQNGDLLFVRSNGNKDLVGRCILIDNLSEPIAYSGFTIRARLTKKEILPEFVAHSFRARYIKSQMLEAGGGTNISNLSQDILSTIEILLPPLPEQKKIAEILGSWDTAIEQLETLIEKKQLLKRGLMQKLLSGKVRFPEFEGEEWGNYNLGEVVKLNYGKSQKDVQIDNGVYPIYGTGGILGYANEYLYEGDSILIGRKGTIDKPIRIKGKFWIVDTAYYASDFKSIDVDFLLFRLQFLDLKSLNEASGVPSLNRDTFYNTKIQLPSLDQQKKIVKPLCLLDLEINYLSQQLEALKTQKLGLMQQLLMGRRRVNT